jgi:hypothetical protein
MVKCTISSNHPKIREHIVQYYNSLYTRQFSWRSMLDDLSFESISKVEANWLERAYEGGGVFEVVKAYNSNKAVSTEGFSIAFFQACGDALKYDTMKIFHDFHDGGKFERTLNATMTALISKKSGAIDIKNFRPISLVGRVYKIVAKVVANRLKMVLEKINCNF